jgi:acetolactate synthase-1/2/3 large subunit
MRRAHYGPRRGTRFRCLPSCIITVATTKNLVHVQRLSNFRNRVANLGDDLGPIGTSIMNPDIEYHKLAESMGWWAKGPVKDPAELGPAIKKAVAVVQAGQPALVNVWTQPR